MDEREMEQLRQARIRRRKKQRRKKRFLKRCRLVLAVLLIFTIVLGMGKMLCRRNTPEPGVLSELIPVFERIEPVDIVLDAGHGGKNQGADSSNVLEKTINLEIAQKVKKLLEASDYRIGMVREDDTFVSLEERAEYANERNAKIFISIHCNSSESGEGDGIETYYSEQKTGADQDLAKILQEAVIAQTNAKDREAKSADYVVLTQTKMPSALVEVGFLSDTSERTLLQQEDYQEKLAQGIAEAVLTYLEEKQL